MHGPLIPQDSPQRDTRLIVHPGRCAQPVWLHGKVDYLDSGSGELLHRYTTAHEPGGVLRVPCKTRRSSRCPSCAETYRADTYQLIRAGLTGGKGVPVTVAAHPCLFVTLTAPSFGPVHARREKDGRVLACRPRRDGGTCPHGRPLGCGERHHADDPRVSEPICPDCYDYTGSVLFNAVAPELWRRFTIALRRTLARLVGMTQKDLKDRVRVSFAKVAEYQRRGVVHFHAVIRIDGPDGPTTQPPSWATADLLADAVGTAAAAVQVATPPAAPIGSRVLRWGAQLDVRPVAADGELTDNAVAGYVAKYATKAAECTGTLDRRVSSAENLDDLPITSHERRLIAECLRIAQVPDLAELRTGQWAHMLGFRGHFSTKSRAYSTTLGALRAARAEHIRAEHADELPSGDTVLVVADWHFAGLGTLDDLDAGDLDDNPPIHPASAIPPPAERRESDREHAIAHRRRSCRAASR